MTARDELKIWASQTVVDPIELTPNKLSIGDDLWLNGWLRLNPVNAQHINTLLNLLSDVAKNDTLSPALNLSDVDDVVAARTNLGIILTDYLRKDQNLADVPNKATARANLELNTTLFNEFFDKIYPVGTVYENKTNSANPNTYLGRGTWVAEGAGRVAIGAGAGTDVNGYVQNFTAGSTGGEYRHTMTETELVSHAHLLLGCTNSDTNLDPLNGNAIAGDLDSSAIGAYTNSGSGSRQLVQSTGGGQPFNITQPYITYYRWLRTA